MQSRNTRIDRLAVSLIFLISAIGGGWGHAQSKTLLYQGSWHNVPCSVTINWTNFSGPGPVDGEIFISGDKSYRFTGNAPVDGKMEITVPGDPVYRFDRTIANGKSTWTLMPGGGVVFSRNAGGSGLPGGGGGSGLPGGGMAPHKPDPKTTVSSGSWGGQPISITINWDNYKGQGPVSGSLLFNGSSYPFAGSNPRKGYMEISIEGVNGVYQLNKNGTGSSAVWSGSLNGTFLSFSRSASVPGGGGGGMPPAGGDWLIACEASRDRATAEKSVLAWRNRGFAGALVVHKTEYRSLDGDQDWWIACPGKGSYAAMKALLPRVKNHYPTGYGIKADQSSKRETFH